MEDIHPSLHSFTLNKEIGYCYFEGGTTTVKKIENEIYTRRTYNYQDISKLISEGIFIKDNHPRSVF
ncbi:hypothetical protein FDI40_gp396 [Agrobacterium phage Atu_ph07]|uniref:Uncharacterized protein n=1 Tax=Agrobacterium phage Atu_ph07 TaxID=2024264 RepID=A0A2L0V053_9CAUD|nr:hypothetical protein FDI40_gp396 [Agrobacterium phage Atu_ph07]AUZ95155.1 hypothetical protein [Agrobacterium phage Atu_ph07]